MNKLKIAAMCAGLLLLLTACEDRVQSLPKFKAGDIVTTVIGAKTGMVTSTFCWGRKPKDGPPPSCEYWVRLLAVEITTDTGWISDGPVDISPFSTVKFKEFEIRGAP